MRQITISNSAYQAIAQGYGDVAAFLEQYGTADAPPTSALPHVPDTIDVDALIRTQSVQPIHDFRKLRADFVPPGETTEALLSTIDERRRHDAPAAG